MEEEKEEIETKLQNVRVELQTLECVTIQLKDIQLWIEVFEESFPDLLFDFHYINMYGDYKVDIRKNTE
jgi:hypothetical protein